jgi:hypothetical protein
MIALATFLTCHFGQWADRWHGRTDAQPAVANGQGMPVAWTNEGVLAAIDFESRRILWWMILDTPSGFGMDTEHIFINSMYGNRILVFDGEFHLQRSFAHPLMNDLHGLTLIDSGLLIASSGADTAMEINYQGDLCWAWHATENGFPLPIPSVRREKMRESDFRGKTIHTGSQATHCNCVVPNPRNRNENFVILWTQGSILAVNTRDGSYRTVLSGLNCPHSLRPFGEGWVLSDSAANSVVILDSDLWIEEIIEGPFDWVQDATPFRAGELIISDANHNRFVFWNKDLGLHSELKYEREWKIYQLEFVSEEWASRIKNLERRGKPVGIEDR